MTFPLVSLCGSYHANKDWYPHCVSSWRRVKGAEQVIVVDDGSLTDEDEAKIRQFGYDVLTIDKVEEIVQGTISPYPALQKMRARSITFRKIIDINSLFPDKERVLFVDSDVYVRGNVAMPSSPPDFLWVVAGVSGYRGSPLLPIRNSMVVGFNAGFVFWNPRACDWDFLNAITEKYLLHVDNEFWTEQAAWAALAGRADRKGRFDGRDVCNVSGLRKRTPEEVKANVTKWFGQSGPIENPGVVRDMVRGTSVVHFPGVGKKWIEDFATPREDADEVRTLRWEPVENANLLERGLLALRMAWSNRR